MERRFRITVEGRAYEVTVEDLSDSGHSLYPQPGSMSVPQPPSPPSPLVAPAAPATADRPPGAGDVVATLGGVIESVRVQLGQTVDKGDTVVVLEAMKMKSMMLAPFAGRVVVLAVQAGDAVEAGQILASIG